jgi:hypothetical protein
VIVCGGSLLTRRFTRFALEDRHASCMTCGPGPPCPRRGCLGARCASDGIPCSVSGRERESFLEKGFAPHAAVTLSHSLPIACAPLLSCFFVPCPRHWLCPFVFVLLSSTSTLPWLRSVTPTASNLRGSSTWCAACLGGAL